MEVGSRRGGHLHIDPVEAVGQHLEAQVGVELLHVDVLSGLVLVGDEEVHVAAQAAVLGPRTSRQEPVVGPAGEAGPVLRAFDLYRVVVGRTPASLHREGLRAVVRLGDHEPGQLAVADVRRQHALLGLLGGVLDNRLQEQAPVDAHDQAQRQRVVARLLQHRQPVPDRPASAAVLLGHEHRQGVHVPEALDHERGHSALGPGGIHVMARAEEVRQPVTVGGDEV